MSTASPAILSNFSEKQWTQNHPQYLSRLLGALYPTTFLEIAVCVSLPADLLWGSFVTHSFLPRYLIQAHLRGGGGLFNLERTMVSVLHKEVEYGVEKFKYKTF